MKMVDANLATHPHPAVQLQYMEICVRYVQFFEHNPAAIPRVLDSFVRFVHSDHDKVRWIAVVVLVPALCAASAGAARRPGANGRSGHR